MSRPVLRAQSNALLRLDPLRNERKPEAISFSGGVSEYILRARARGFGDLGPALARAILERVKAWGPRVVRFRRRDPRDGHRRFPNTRPSERQHHLRRAANRAPFEKRAGRDANCPSTTRTLAVERISESVGAALRRLDLDDGERPVALCYRWKGSATFGRLDAFCRGIVSGLANELGRGLPLILVGDGDSGTDGIHCREETRLPNPIVSIDGIALKEFDFIDIGTLLETSGACRW